MQNSYEEVLRLLSIKLRAVLMAGSFDKAKLQEIRLRVNRPLTIRAGRIERCMRPDGKFTENIRDAYSVTFQDIKETMEYISNYSPYAFEEELRQCFITVTGGHRVGICGRTVLEDNKIKAIRNVSSVNIRLAHEIKGCADKYIDLIMHTNETDIYNTLIISPPCCGKTTLLRDTIRQLSNKGLRISVVDERSEIGACYLGVPQNDIGQHTDIMDCCPKAEGIMKMLRAMSPQVIAVDEIGTPADMEAATYAMISGSRLLCTIHGASISDIEKKTCLAGKMNMFERAIVLDKNMQGVIYKLQGGSTYGT